MNLSETMPRFGEDISSNSITISLHATIKLNDYNKNGSIGQTKSRPPLPARGSEKESRRHCHRPAVAESHPLTPSLSAITIRQPSRIDPLISKGRKVLGKF